MTKVNHTDGPWTFDPESGEVLSPFGSICTVHGADNPDDETVPNGELLASAPLLQEQVKLLRKALERVGSILGSGENEWECKRARSAAGRGNDIIESALKATKEGA